MLPSDSICPSPHRGFLAPGAFALALLFLTAAFLLSGCEMENGNFVDDHKLNPGLIGKWKSEYNGGAEVYTITETTFVYEDTFLGIWGGKIDYVSNFSKNAGVLIIEYDGDKKQRWKNWETSEDITPPGNFYGIYFNSLTENTVKLANTSDQKANYGPTETETSREAREKFTLGNKGDLTSSGGNPQTRERP
jgi:hypothetical protein